MFDNVAAPGAIAFTATSGNGAIIPQANIQVQTGDFTQYGFHFNRNLVITPLPDQSGRTLITMVENNGFVSRTAYFYLDVAAPAAPTNAPVLSGNVGNNKVALSWTFNPGNGTGASGYNVYRSLTSGGPYTKIATGLTNTSYTDTGLTNGTTYYYVVTATAGAGAFESANSNEIAAVPQNVFLGNGDGLLGQYYSGDDATFTFTGKTPIVTHIDPTINFDINNNALHFPSGVPNNNFTAKWTGFVQPPITGSYVFTINSDDGSILKLDTGAGLQKIVDNNAYQGTTAKSSAAITLIGGQKYAIEMDYYQGGGGAVAQLTWTYGAVNNQIIPQTQLYSNTVGGATVTGNIALEGVSDLAKIKSAVAPLGTFDIQFRTPGTLTVVKEFPAVTLTTTAGSANGKFAVGGVAPGTYDVWIKGGKNLAALNSGVTISGTSGTVPDSLLGAGDSDNNNTVDVLDFGNLVNSYGTDSAQNNGYSANADFNFDGVVDVLDFGLLVNEYGVIGPK